MLPRGRVAARGRDRREEPRIRPATRRNLTILAGLLLAGCRGEVEAMGEGPPPPGTRGLADYHVHQFASESLGGRWLWGEPDGPPAEALAPCSGRGIDHGFLASSEGPFLNLGRHDARGHPDYEGWPRWDSLSHQQVHAGWLKEAHAQGLDLMILSAMDQSDFCALMPDRLRDRPCDDFASVKRQIALARAFERRHADWYDVVESPAEARAAIAEGRLAVVLAVEAGDVFDGADDPLARLAELHALGVRVLQPVHETDNRFAGAAWHSPPLWALETSHFRRHPEEREAQRRLEREDGCHRNGSCPAHTADVAGFVLDEAGLNRRGLTALGEALIGAMMDLGMIVDVAHLSERSIADAHRMARARSWYPLFVSHAHFRDLEPDEVGEWSYGLGVYQQVLETGGVVGVRSSASVTRTYTGSGVANDCAGSSKSFAQRLAFVSRELGLGVGFASDFGGLATNLAPRFGAEACADASGGRRRRQAEAQTGRTGLRIDQRGWGHIGQVGEVMQELRQIGADTAPLAQGAEVFLRMWERVEDPGRRRVLRTFDPDAARATLTDPG
ncbi:MAG: membrane dipeptidase [Alphaproteobacteria bacterium]|nr:membrane dipeptidase [Alphaproteobacteria bacterium]MCB9791126.1 membrane dipeptidase [Alphaproteobacteria bacterium]